MTKIHLFTFNTLLEEVAKGIKAEIPEAMIEKTIDDDVNEYSYRLQSQGPSISLGWKAWIPRR